METRILGNVSIHGSVRLAQNEAGFPANPQIGTIIVKDQCIYAYIKIGGLETWYPFASRTNSYVHVQGLPALVWDINHGLGTTDVWSQVKDDSGNIIQALVTAVDADNAIITFTAPITGTAVIVAPDTIDVPEVKAVSINVANSAVIIDSSGVRIDGSYALTAANIETYAQAAVQAEANTRAAADTTLQNNINAEATARANADTAIQSTISNNIDQSVKTTATPQFAGLKLAGHVLPNTDIAYDLGSTNKRFRDLYLSGSTIHLGDGKISYNATTNTFDLLNPQSAPAKTSLGANTTDDLAEGTNRLYFTTARAQALIDVEANARQSADDALQTLIDEKQNILGFTPENIANRGVANGYASLGSDGKVPAAQLPSYVDDVVEYTNLSGFPITGETAKIYVALDTNKTYRWSGTAYVQITSGAVDSVAGKTGVVTLDKSDVGLSAVDNTSDLNKPISTATQTALDNKASTTHTHSGVYEPADVTILKSAAIGVSVQAFDANYVKDANYKHITVTSSSVSDGNNTFAQYSHPTTHSISEISGLQDALDAASKTETTTTLALVGNTLTYTNETGIPTNIDLAKYLDEDARAIASGVLDSTTGIVTFTRDDSTTFTLDLGGLLDDTNAVTSVAGKTGVVTLDKSDVGLSAVDNTADSIKSVLSASRLTTARSIGGTSFDGQSNIDISYTNLIDKPILGTAASKDTPASGNAIAGQVVLGNDTRLSDARTPTAHNQAWSTITNTPTTATGYGITDVAPSSHVGSTGGAHGDATTTVSGFMSATDKTKLDGVATNANNYSLPVATDVVSGGVKLASATAQTVAANTVTSTASRTYGIQSNASGQLVVNVPWVDTDTVYTHPTSDGNLHVPATGTTNNGKVLTAGATAGSLSWQTPSTIDSTKLPLSGGTMTGSITFAAGQTWPTFNQDTTGNANTATTLATARTINGVLFNGSSDITINAVDSTSRVAASNGTASGLTLNDGYTEEVFAVTGTTPALSPNTGSIQTWTLTGNSTPTLGTWGSGQSMTLLIDDGTAYAIDWASTGIVWKTGGGTAPVLLTAGYTTLALVNVGGTVYGWMAGDA